MKHRQRQPEEDNEDVAVYCYWYGFDSSHVVLYRWPVKLVLLFVSALLSCLKITKLVFEVVLLCGEWGRVVWLSVRPLQLGNESNHSNKTRCGHYAIGGHTNTVLLNFLQLVMTIWRAHELARWEGHLILCTAIPWNKVLVLLGCAKRSL